MSSLNFARTKRRGFVTQGGASSELVRGNIFHSLRQPAYLNPGSSGTIMDNVAYNTRGYVVDGADFVFSGNSWGLPANAAAPLLTKARRWCMMYQNILM